MRHIIMRRTKVLGAVSIAALALTAVSATGASAKESLLLTAGGVPVSPGTPVFQKLDVFGSGSCTDYSSGKVSSNGRPKDTLSFSTFDGAECETGWSSSGELKLVELTSTGIGVLKFGPKLAIRNTDPCVWEVTKLTGTLPPEENGEAIIFAKASAKLNKKASIPFCSKTITVEVEAFEFDESLGVVFETELNE
jgi:hypothetical protein